ncbi:unnamed protein product [Thelazia callipaeda]|uniref:PDZ domain-containing protein n=1 Tax=Thelazia callipaeda TaxID=103827 RepID=A0A0N5D2Z5_THECL|nr:unnamed protein product [Thelazia callipaeda]
MDGDNICYHDELAAATKAALNREGLWNVKNSQSASNDYSYEEIEIVPTKMSEYMEAFANVGNGLSDVEYEKVVLKRSRSCPRLGLKLCYNTEIENGTDIFIGEIECGSIADLDGRLKLGDQILQVNGEAIYGPNSAKEQFRCSGDQVSLLLARSVHNEFELVMEASGVGLNTEDKGVLTDVNSSNSTLEKDSGLSRMTDSDLELLPPPILSSLNQSTESLIDLPVMTDQRLKRCVSENSLERELASLHREMETIRLECDRLISKHTDNERDFAKMSQIETNGGSNVSDVKIDGKGRLEDTSSAYNTGESCRSTPLKPDALVQIKKDSKIVHPNYTVPKFAEDMTRCMVLQKPSTSQIPQVKFRLPQYSVVLREWGKKESKVIQADNDQQAVASNNGKKVKTQGMLSETRKADNNKAGITMYTKPQKLAETIALQQRLLREAMVEQAHMLRASSANVTGTCNSKSDQNAIRNQTKEQYQNVKARETCEWKIKRRADGSRYITKKPIRNKLLKEREEQLNKERIGVSTDDDAMSELKTGRFWTREERKKQWERAKQRKLRHHQLMAQRIQQPSDQLIVQLSKKKMMRRKGNRLLDKFTTIQEFMAHGNRDISSRSIDGILSVTTV